MKLIDLINNRKQVPEDNSYIGAYVKLQLSKLVHGSSNIIKTMHAGMQVMVLPDCACLRPANWAALPIAI